MEHARIIFNLSKSNRFLSRGFLSRHLQVNQSPSWLCAQTEGFCQSATPVNQKEEESSVLYAKNFYVCVSWEKDGVVVDEVLERMCHFWFLCGLFSPKDTTAEQLCRMHIVPGLHMIEDMIKAKTMWTLSGHQLTFTSQVRNLLKAWACFHTGQAGA